MAKFPMGQLVMSRGVNDEAAENEEFAKFVVLCLRRHLDCDWGDMCVEDKWANDEALKVGERLFSSYVKGEWKVWVITEADRSATTALFPSDY